MYPKGIYERKSHTREAQWKHKSSLNKTLDLVERFYYWPKMQRDVRRYVEKCGICQKAKGTSSNTRVYQPIHIPNRPGECNNMDFIV